MMNFCNTFGAKTTVAEIISLVNESFPSASQFTGATSPKSLTSSNLSISDFFYAAKNKETARRFSFHPLDGDDGSDCTIKATIKQSCTTTNTSKTLTVADSSKLAVGMIVSGTGITGTVAIESITNSTTVVLDTVTASGTNTLTFTTEDLIPSVCDLTVFTDKEDLKDLVLIGQLEKEGRIFF